MDDPLPLSRLHALDGGVVRDDLVKVEEYPRKVRDEEPDDDRDEDHGHLVLGAPPLHVRRLLVREGARRSVLAEGRGSDLRHLGSLFAYRDGYPQPPLRCCLRLDRGV